MTTLTETDVQSDLNAVNSQLAELVEELKKELVFYYLRMVSVKMLSRESKF